MVWANLSQADRITYLETLVRQALQSGELLAPSADAVYALGQRLDLSIDEQHLLNILNDAILQGSVKPAQTESSLLSPPDVPSTSPQPDAVPSSPSA
jgi:hypothetical protein